jgi:hypothetical protein
MLVPRIDAKGAEVAVLRQEFLSKRVERRQSETLFQEAEAQQAIKASRHEQQSLDEWYGARKRPEAGRLGADAQPITPSAAEDTSCAHEVCKASASPDGLQISLAEEKSTKRKCSIPESGSLDPSLTRF